MKIKDFLFNFRFHRKIQVHLLSLFLFLLCVTVFFITRFTYDKYYKSINDLSNYMVDQTNVILLDQIKNLKKNVELTTELIKGSLHTKAEITGQDPDYVQFFVNILRQNQVLTELMIGTPEGDYFAVMNIRLASSDHFYSRPNEKLPEASSYIFRTILRKGASFKEEWKYLDEGGKILATESIIPVSANFQKNSWILEMIKNPKLVWANELLPRGVSEEKFKRAYSVTVSDVLKNSNGEVIAIMGVGVTLKTLSDFIEGQKIGKNGSAFILDSQGNIKVPMSSDYITNFPYKKALIEDGYREFQKTKQQNFMLKERGEKYLFSIQDSCIFQTDPWFLAIEVPFDDFFGEMVRTQIITRLISLIIFIISGIVTYFCVRNISRPIVRLVTEVDKIRNFDFTVQQHRLSHIQEISDLECSIDAMRSALHSFGRYIPKEIVRTLIKYGRDVSLGGERSEITMMFSDIQNFTTMSESLPIEQLMHLLSEYFDVISKIILEEGGIIDKYIGDSVMSFWGAPVKIANSAEKACLAALRSLSALNQQKKWTTRFGIHTGEVIVGNIGTSERINYTVIGDAVNVASRLQSINKEYHTSIIVSESVYQQIEQIFVTRPLDFVAVKGKKEKLRIYELMGTKEGDLAATVEQLELSALFTHAYESFEKGNREDSLQCFLDIQKKFPLDFPTKKCIDRIRA